MVRRETVDIVILGGSYAALSVAHQFLYKTIHELRTTSTAPRYRVVLVAPNTHLFWNIGAPRAICTNDIDEAEQYFFPFLDSFNFYEHDEFLFIQGEAIAVDFGQKTVDIALVLTEASKGKGLSGPISIDYHALIIATGSSAHSDLLSLHGTQEETINTIRRFRAELPSAGSCVIVGGGPSGVECAGQLATWVNQTQAPQNSSWKERLRMGKSSGNRDSRGSSSRPFNPEKSVLSSDSVRPQEPLRITLISGGPRLLGKMKPEIGYRAERMLKNLGVRVVHGVRLITAQELPSRSTRCVLSDELTLTADLFIAATGTIPNTSFVGKQFLDASGYVVVDQQSLRVPRAGDRVFAVGSCAALDSKTLLEIFNSVPIILHNLKNDLLECEIKIQYPYGGYEDRIMALKDIWFEPQFRITQLSPISRWGGVGVIKGHRIPSLLVWLLKGRDYNLRRATKVTQFGERPYTAR
jgi:NADH dehydrogenase FAD-containing subunit